MMALLAIPVAFGVIQALVATWHVFRFADRRWSRPHDQPPVTVLKPLYGDEPLLELALATLFEQDYPEYQIVFGVQSADDPAIAVVDRLRARYPAAEMALVVEPARHGANGKVSNLINMLPAARHDLLVIADSDVHAPAFYLERLVAALSRPGAGLATTLYCGLPATGRLAALLGAMQITHVFLPSAVLARRLGRQDCLGATMALRRRDLIAIGGLRGLVNHLADDQVLGRRVAALGYTVELAGVVVQTTVPETSLRDLFRHELRWARTVRALEPAAFAASVLQYPLAWALLALTLSHAAFWSLGVFTTAWVLRAVAAIGVDQALAKPRQGERPVLFACPIWLLPLREVLSVLIMMASYAGRRVIWRGHGLEADTPERYAAVATRSFEESQTR
jgi:ceramide glucosyltransferase